MNRFGSVGIATRLRAGQPRKPELIPGPGKGFFCSRKRLGRLWGAPRHLTASRVARVISSSWHEQGRRRLYLLKWLSSHTYRGRSAVQGLAPERYNRGFEIHSGINMCLCHFSWCCPVKVHSLRRVERSRKESYHMSTNKTEMPPPPKKTEVLVFHHVLGSLVLFLSLTGPGAYPANRGWIGRVVVLTAHPHLSAGVMKG